MWPLACGLINIKLNNQRITSTSSWLFSKTFVSRSFNCCGLAWAFGEEEIDLSSNSKSSEVDDPSCVKLL